MVLTVTQMLRQKGVVGKFVEFYGPGLDNLSLEDAATIANMAPEYGATMGFFPVDQKTLDYLNMTGREEGLIEAVEAMTTMQRSNEHPQGDKLFNGKTHQVFGPQYISKVENNKLVVQHTTSIEDGLYPDEVDYTTQAL